MKKYIRTIIATVLCYVMVLSMLPAMSLTAFAASYTGTGTETNPYMVSTGAELIEVLNNYNAEGVYIKLDSNITLTDTYVPGVFNGILDGDFHKITAVTPFFTTNEGTLKNFFYTDTVQITESTGSYDGVVCNSNNGLISGVIATGDIAGDCYHTSSGDNDRSGPSRIGIIAGNNSGTIVNCAAFGSLSAHCSYGSHAGAITYSGNKVYNCYASATVSATGGSRYGSSSSHPISLGSFANCYYNADVQKTGEAGGLTTAEMKTQQFVSMLNGNSEVPTDSVWVMDTKNVNGGFPVLKRAMNAAITSSKTDILIHGTESVTLTCDDSSATIYYTLDGENPTVNSKRYTGPISITNDTTIKAVAYKNGLYSATEVFFYAAVTGAGTKAQPYLIDSGADFKAMQELENTAYFRITRDITMEDEMFSINTFYGNIDGQGYTVSGIYSNRFISSFVQKNYGVIQNINFVMKGNADFLTGAAFAYYNYGVIYNCHYTGNINGGSMYCVQSWNVGGLVADNYGRLEKCSFTGRVYADDASKAGGVVGYNAGDVCYCSFDGEVDIASASFQCNSSFQGYVGGFVGYAATNSSVKYCTADVTSVHSAVLKYTGVYVGGFVGNENTTTIVDCTAQIGSVTYGSGYTEWGYSGTNYYTGTSTGNPIPTAHTHNFNFVIQNPVCGEDCRGISSCSCGVQVTSSWYDSAWWGKRHMGGTATCTQQAICEACGTAYGELNTNNHTGMSAMLVQNDAVNPFTYADGKYTSTNKTGNSISTLTVTAQSACTIGVTVAYSTEQKYDKGIISKNGVQIRDVSGTGSVTESVILAAGDVLTIQYSKDGSVSNGTDSITVTLDGSLAKLEATCTDSVRCTDCGVVEPALGHNCLTGVNNTTYPFAYADGVYTSTNKANSSSAAYTYTAQMDVKVTVEYSVSSETNFDKLLILKNGSTLYTYTGVKSGTVEITLAAGDKLVFKYSKDSSGSTGSDSASFAIRSQTARYPCLQSVICDVCGVNTAVAHSFVDCVCTVCSTEDLIDSGSCGQNVNWRLRTNGTMVISGTGAMDDYTFSNYKERPWDSYAYNGIQSVIIENGVTRVGAYAFYNCRAELTNVEIGDSVTVVGEGAFRHCGLRQVTLGKNVVELGVDSFYDNSYLGNVVLPDGLQIIGNSAFSWCLEMTEVVIPDSVTSIGVYAFCNNDKLETVTIGSGVTAIADDAFCHCDKLTGIWVKEDNTAFSSDTSGVLYNKDKTALIQIPNTYVGDFAIPEGVVSVWEYAFYGCKNITNITVPASVAAESSYLTFNATCEQLAGIWVSEDNADFSSDAFGVLFNKDKTVLLQAPRALSGSYEIPDGVATIEQGAFAYCSSLQEVHIPVSVTAIAQNTFNSCNELKNITYSGTSEQWESLEVSNLDGVTVHFVVEHEAKVPTCTQVGWEPYRTCVNCDYTTYTQIPELGHSFTEYVSDYNAACVTNCTQTAKCDRCDETDTVDIPDTKLGHVFLDGTCLRCGDTVDLYAYEVVDGQAIITACQPDMAVGVLTIPAALGGYPVTAIGDGAFAQCDRLTSIIIADSVAEIGDNAFQGCVNLSVVTMSAGICVIGSSAFEGCTALEEVYCGIDQTQLQRTTIAEGNDLLVAANWNYQHVHDFSIFPTVTVAPTCTEKGYIEYMCIFGETYRATIPALGHDHSGIVTVDPTCMEAGYTQTCCIRCGDVKSTEPILPLGHDYSGTVTVVEPDCLNGGYTLTQCIRCDSTETTASVDALGHDCTEEVLTVTPDCLNGGYTTYKCVRCDVTDTRDYLAALDHDYSGTVTVIEPTCKEQGYTLTQCIRCDSIQTSNIKNVVAHQMTILPAVSATCTEPGLTIGSVCQWCGFVGVAQKEVPALGHTYVDHAGQAPTCVASGWAAYETCENCEYTTYVELPALGHTYVDHAGRAPTCTEIGWNAYQTCQTCDFSSYEELLALGHDFAEGVCVRCGEADPDYVPEGITGDLDGDNAVSNNDVLALLWYTLFPEENTITGNVDFTGDGNVTNEDVLKLLWHCLFPEENPL